MYVHVLATILLTGGTKFEDSSAAALFIEFVFAMFFFEDRMHSVITVLATHLHWFERK